MCVAIPGKIISMADGRAVVDFSGNHVTAYVGLVNAKVGDYVLVHAGCVIQTLKKQEAQEIAELMSGLDGGKNDGAPQQTGAREGMDVSYDI